MGFSGEAAGTRLAGRLVRPAARARRPFVTGWHHGGVADQGSGSGYEPSLGYLTSMAIRIFLLVGLVLGGLSFLLLFVLVASYQADGTGTLNDMILWILERVFFDGLDLRMSLGAMFGKVLWTGMCSLGLLPLVLALLARQVTRQLWEEPRHHVLRLVGLGLSLLILVNPVGLVHAGLPFGLSLQALTWGPAFVLIGSCLDRQLFGAEKPVWMRSWLRAGKSSPVPAGPVPAGMGTVPRPMPPMGAPGPVPAPVGRPLPPAPMAPPPGPAPMGPPGQYPARTGQQAMPPAPQGGRPLPYPPTWPPMTGPNPR